MINTSLISLIVALAMFFSGGYVAEDPNAYSARSLRLSDIVVTIEGTEYPLNLEPVFGAATENGSALFDVSLIDGENVLFPVQAKIGTDGLTLLLGDGSDAYQLTTDYLYSTIGLDEIPDELNTIIGMYIDLLASAAELETIDPYDPELNAQIETVVNDIVGPIPAEAVTIEFDGETLDATYREYNLDSVQLPQLVDAVYEVIAPGYMESYFGVLAYTYELGGLSEGNVPESFADLFAMSGVQMTADIVETLSEDGRGYADVTFNMSVDIGEEFPLVMSLPMEIISYDEDTASATMSTDLDIDGELIHLNVYSYADGGNLSAEFSATDDYGTSVSFNTAAYMAEDGAVESSASMIMYAADEVMFSLDVSSAYDASGVGEMTLNTDLMGLYGLSLTAATSADPIVDRIASAEVTSVSNDEEMETASTGLAVSAISLMDDAEALMGNEGLMELIAAIEALIPEEEELVFEEYTAEAPESAGAEVNPDSVEGSAEDLSFPMPEFTWLPEGYELADSFVYAEYDSANLYFEYTGDSDEYRSTLYVDLCAAFSESTEYVLGAEGLATLEAPVITVEREPDAVYIETVINGVEISVSYYETLTDEEIWQLMNGIVFEAAPAEAVDPSEVEGEWNESASVVPEKQIVAN